MKQAIVFFSKQLLTIRQMLFDVGLHMSYSVSPSRHPRCLQHLSKSKDTALSTNVILKNNHWLLNIFKQYTQINIRVRHGTQHPKISVHLRRLGCLFLVATRACDPACNNPRYLNLIFPLYRSCSSWSHPHTFVCHWRCDFLYEQNIFLDYQSYFVGMPPQCSRETTSECLTVT